MFSKSKRTFWTVVLLAILVMFIPLPYQVRCRSELQPVMRRFVPAPYEGTLDNALVEPGDLVEKGQVIARMDSREIEWQLAAERANYQRARKERDVAMSMRDTAAAQVAGLDMDRVSGQIDILENRLDNLEIKSPIEGVVLSGDPKKLEGARLALGQNLFEIGPLDRLIMEVEIPDREIAHVKPGQTARTRLEAFPSQQLSGVVQRINPRSETRHHANVFVAEVTLTNPDQQLRPGMEGRSRISTAYHTLGWIVFHRLCNKLQLFFG
jgi:RND family efflux transporter MFP subunit